MDFNDASGNFCLNDDCPAFIQSHRRPKFPSETTNCDGCGGELQFGFSEESAVAISENLSDDPPVNRPDSASSVKIDDEELTPSLRRRVGYSLGGTIFGGVMVALAFNDPAEGITPLKLMLGAGGGLNLYLGLAELSKALLNPRSSEPQSPDNPIPDWLMLAVIGAIVTALALVALDSANLLGRSDSPAINALIGITLFGAIFAIGKLLGLGGGPRRQ